MSQNLWLIDVKIFRLVPFQQGSLTVISLQRQNFNFENNLKKSSFTTVSIIMIDNNALMLMLYTGSLFY